MNSKIGAKDLITLGHLFCDRSSVISSRFYSHYGSILPGSLGAHQWNCIYAVHNKG